jgi:hypothetical protein
MTTRKSVTYLLIALPFLSFMGVMIFESGLKRGLALWFVSIIIGGLSVVCGLAIVYFLPKKWTYTLSDLAKRQIKPVKKNVQATTKKRGG